MNSRTMAAESLLSLEVRPSVIVRQMSHDMEDYKA